MPKGWGKYILFFSNKSATDTLTQLWRKIPPSSITGIYLKMGKKTQFKSLTLILSAIYTSVFSKKCATVDELALTALGGATQIGLLQRYLREVDSLRHNSWQIIHFNKTRVLSAATNKTGRWAGWIFVPSLTANIFVPATLTTGRQYVSIMSLFNEISMDLWACSQMCSGQVEPLNVYRQKV